MNYVRLLRQVRKAPRVHGYVAPETETRMSPIQGLGLFAKKPLKKGTVVAVWGGKVTTLKEANKLPREIGLHYALELRPGFYLAERTLKELDCADFINHSCEPNCIIADRFSMLTQRAVEAGEELTADFSNGKRRGNHFTCDCGSKKCKGRVYFD